MLQYVMKSGSERGSAIIMLFVAVALFGLISYVFLQGSGGSTSMITSEASKAAGYQSQDCTNAINMATKRLTARGCGALISMNTDGTPVAGGPADGSCSIFHPNGGGVKAGCAPTPTCDITTLAIGEECGGVVYAGSIGGARLYTTPADSGSGIKWNNGVTTSVSTTATSVSNGIVNTNTLVSLSNSHAPYAAAVLCRGLGAEWYLPAPDELQVLYTNSVTIGGFSTGGTLGDMYWTSRQVSGTHAYAKYFDDGAVLGVQKFSNLRVRCIRRD